MGWFSKREEQNIGNVINSGVEALGSSATSEHPNCPDCGHAYTSTYDFMHHHSGSNCFNEEARLVRFDAILNADYSKPAPLIYYSNCSYCVGKCTGHYA